MQLHFKAYGQGDPLLILHGLFGSLDNWHTLSRKLAERFDVLAVDQRNHGHSPHSQEMNYPAMARDLNQLLDAQGLARAHLIGHSMGGKTAMQFALLFPERVEKLVIVDIAPRAYPPRHEAILEALSALQLPDFPSRHPLEAALANAIPELPLRQFLLKNVQRDPQGIFQWRIGLQEIRQNYPALRAAVISDTRFEGPTLFVRGERSDYLLEEDLPAIHRLFPRAILETVPQSGHLVHVENPAAFLSSVLSFLAPLPAHARPGKDA